MTDDIKSSEGLLLQRRLDRHQAEFDAHKQEANERWEQLSADREETTTQLKLVVSALDNVSESTREVVNAYSTGKNVGKFVKWSVTTFGGLAIIFSWFREHIIDWFS